MSGPDRSYPLAEYPLIDLDRWVKKTLTQSLQGFLAAVVLLPAFASVVAEGADCESVRKAVGAPSSATKGRGNAHHYPIGGKGLRSV